ncbi:hypothetical protein Q5P01_013837 [Channa striata]|uniref:Uncharacterized protein n=1 Tax=Channa striata TaxID=64152 RepID=A0AA88MN60_CHASR|nr:hypothetical protein Q5P01_013837 [Channa striata]
MTTTTAALTTSNHGDCFPTHHNSCPDHQRDDCFPHHRCHDPHDYNHRCPYHHHDYNNCCPSHHHNNHGDGYPHEDCCRHNHHLDNGDPHPHDYNDRCPYHDNNCPYHHDYNNCCPDHHHNNHGDGCPHYHDHNSCPSHHHINHGDGYPHDDCCPHNHHLDNGGPHPHYYNNRCPYHNDNCPYYHHGYNNCCPSHHHNNHVVDIVHKFCRCYVFFFCRRHDYQLRRSNDRNNRITSNNRLSCYRNRVYQLRHNSGRHDIDDYCSRFDNQLRHNYGNRGYFSHNTWFIHGYGSVVDNIVHKFCRCYDFFFCSSHDYQLRRSIN